MSKLVNIRERMLGCLKSEERWTPFIAFCAVSPRWKHRVQVWTEDTNRIRDAPQKPFFGCHSRPSLHLWPPTHFQTPLGFSPPQECPSYMCSGRIHFHRSSFPIWRQRTTQSLSQRLVLDMWPSPTTYCVPMPLDLSFADKTCALSFPTLGNLSPLFTCSLLSILRSKEASPPEWHFQLVKPNN